MENIMNMTEKNEIRNAIYEALRCIDKIEEREEKEITSEKTAGEMTNFELKKTEGGMPMLYFEYGEQSYGLIPFRRYCFSVHHIVHGTKMAENGICSTYPLPFETIISSVEDKLAVWLYLKGQAMDAFGQISTRLNAVLPATHGNICEATIFDLYIDEVFRYITGEEKVPFIR